MVILSFLATMLWIAMLLGFLVAVFWVIAVVVFIRGFRRWVHGDDQVKQIEEEEDRSASTSLNRRLVLSACPLCY
jgi:type III secretory pathway component EscV